MHIRIRDLTSTSARPEDVIFKVSKSEKIGQLQAKIFNKMKIDIRLQKLYYRGKLLIPDHRITDYEIKLNDVIQLYVKSGLETIADLEKPKEFQQNEKITEAKSNYFKIGDLIDVIDKDHGAWFEARICSIYTRKILQETQEKDLIFSIKMDRNEGNAPFEANFNEIRPRAHYTYKLSELKPSMLVFANYNIEDPTTRGYWYDFQIKQVTKKGIKGILFVGTDQCKLNNCSIKFTDEIMKIEDRKLLTKREEIKNVPLRKLPPYCETCKDDPEKNCKDCGCSHCSKKESEGILIICDECDQAYHLQCLSPPLSKIPPEAEWYCPACKTDDSEIVKAGEKLKKSQRKMSMPSHKNRTNHEWGKGMACVGRTTECTMVPKDHYGPIPGIEVGTCWKFRLQVSEAGIHRPHVAGIHGRETDGAYSLVLSGGYEDDVDNGEEFWYTGSGGRDLSGNKRVSEQSCDQKLTRMNKALALNCNVKFNNKIGGEAEEWQNGKPVRVVRNYKLGKHSKYAPKDGNRYDGIYKVVKYYPEKGKSGFIVWRYLLRRDDPIPAPWQENGKEFDMIYPPGHLEAEMADQNKKRKKQRNSVENYTKKQKIEPFVISKELEKFIKADLENTKLWNECSEATSKGKLQFLNTVEEKFLCVCCQEVVYQPVTVPCKHNICKDCLRRSFDAEMYVCPCCRFELGEKYRIQVNENLGNVLKLIFPGYETNR